MVFILSALWWMWIRGLWKLPDGRPWLRGKLGLVLMGGTMLSKSLIQFSVDGHCCVPCLLFDLRPNYGGGNEDNGDLTEKVPCTDCLTHCPRTCSRPLLTHASPEDTPGHSQESLNQSLVGHCFFLLGPGAHKVLFVPSKSLFPQSCVSSGSSMVGLIAQLHSSHKLAK